MSLKEKTRDRIMNEMIKVVQPKGGWKVVVVDHDAMRALSASCRMYDIMEEGVTLVENLAIARQPLPNIEAIYFISPCSESVDALINDFKDPKEPQYAAVHLFFISRLSDAELKKIKQSNVLPKVKTLKELNVDFIAHESNVFHFDSVDSFKILFSPDSTSRSAEMKSIAEKLLCVCATLGDYPSIRYMTNKESGTHSISHSIAASLQDKLDALVRASSDFANKANAGGNRSQLLIVDRSQDPIAPLLHEFTYQAMIYDLIPIENDIYKYAATTNAGEKKQKEVILGETDPLWPTLRHMHIAETMNWILDNFNDFVKENKASKLYSGKKVTTLKEMGDAMKAMPQYQEMLGKYSLHINLASTAMESFNQNKLATLAGVEQDMATGEDADGKPVKNIISALAPLLTDSEVSMLDKIRLLMIYIISQEGIKDSDRKRLMELAKVSFEDQGGISNLRYLGVTLLKGGARGSKKKQSKEKKKKQRDDAPPYELSRYVPVIKQVAEELIEGSLSNTDYPFVKEPMVEGGKQEIKEATSLRKQTQPKWADKNNRKSEKQTTTGGRVMIFIIGGVTFSELRSVYELTKKYNREVVIGSTSLLTPQLYVDGLRSLKKVEALDTEE